MEEKVELIKEFIAQVCDGNLEKEQRLIKQYQQDPAYDFLRPNSSYYLIFSNLKNEYKQKLQKQKNIQLKQQPQEVIEQQKQQQMQQQQILQQQQQMQYNQLMQQQQMKLQQIQQQQQHQQIQQQQNISDHVQHNINQLPPPPTSQKQNQNIQENSQQQQQQQQPNKQQKRKSRFSAAPPSQISQIQNQQSTDVLESIQKLEQLQQQVGNQDLYLPKQVQCIEQLDGSVIAEIIKNQRLKYQQSNINHMPYTPVYYQGLQEKLQVQIQPIGMIKAKVDQLDEFFQNDKKQEQVRIDEKEKQIQREKEIEQLAMQGFEVEYIRELQNGAKNRDIGKEVDEIYGGGGASQQYQGSWRNQEMGIQQDGKAINGGQIRGLGFSQQQPQQMMMQQQQQQPSGVLDDDKFNNYRKQRSFQYHLLAEERAGGSRDGVQLCYKCNRPGHIAKDCKFGLT